MSDDRASFSANKSNKDDEKIEAFISLAARDAAGGLDLILADIGGEAAMAYAGGYVAGIRAWLAVHHGIEGTRELFARMASDADLENDHAAVLQ